MPDTTPPLYQREADILYLIDSFRNRTLPAAEWTHHAHLVTALWFNKTFSEYEAICYLRSGIITYNLQSGGENTPAKGYHETLTLFWCKIIRSFINQHPDIPLPELCTIFLQSEQASRDLPLRFYSREKLFSVEARAIWIEPDIAPL
ncbi:MAG TPA: hypothetical protein VIN08_07250 [Ohtaekwangia sp.]|uniref:hypothetical protein n=1 Tax=Ohtaekwangia sp. TaxID=2066019 RepID=UPI002F941D12